MNPLSRGQNPSESINALWQTASELWPLCYDAEPHLLLVLPGRCHPIRVAVPEVQSSSVGEAAATPIPFV
jgi:hypothetical protein